MATTGRTKIYTHLLRGHPSGRNALLTDGGKAQACGWLIDRYGLRWQIVPRRLDEMMSDGDQARAKVSDVLMKMVKLDIAELEKAYRS